MTYQRNAAPAANVHHDRRRRNAARRAWIPLLLAVSLAAPAAAQWFLRHPQPQGWSLRSVDFTDALHGTAVGDVATILTTSDGGKTWLQRERDTELWPPDIRFHDVSFADQLRGLVVGAYLGTFKSMIVGTTDGGVTWEVRYDTTDGVIVDSVSFVGDTAMAVGRDLRGQPPFSLMMWRSEDGGFTWEELDPPSSDLAFANIEVLDENIAIAVGMPPTADGEDGVILRTTDGGETWETQYSGNEPLSDVSFTSSEIGAAVGNGGTILHTTDGGITWTPQVSGTTEQLHEVSFSDENNGAIRSSHNGGVLLTTTDGGETWTPRPCEIWCFGIDFSDAGTGTMVGVDGAILRTTDGGVTWEQQGLSLTEWFLWDISYGDGDSAIVVGGRLSGGDVAPILRTDDGGNTWVAQESGTTLRLNGVSFVNPDFAIAVGGNLSSAGGGEVGVILRTLDGGETWSDVTPPELPSVALESVHCVDVNHCTAVGNAFGLGSVIVRTEDSGDSWVLQVFPPDNQGGLRSVFFTDAQTGTAVGDSIILRTTDGGVTWEPQSSPTSERLHAVTFTDTDTGFAVGGTGLSGVLIKTTDGGETWVLQESLPAAAEAIAFSDDGTHGAVGTVGGHVFRTQDGGESWQLEQKIYDTRIEGISFGFPETAMLVGKQVYGTMDGSWAAIFKTVGEPTFTLGLSPSSPTVCAPDAGTEELVVGVTVEAVAGYSGTVDLSTSGEPMGVTSDLSSPSVAAPGSSLWTVTLDETVAPGRRVITLTGDGGADPQIAHLRLGVVEPAQAPAPVAPADGAIDVDLRPTFTWEAVPAVDRYRIQVATDAAFEDVVLDRDGEGTSYTASTELASDTQHFWRVRGTTGCAGAWSAVFSFVTRPRPVVEVTPEAVDLEVPVGGSDVATIEIANVETGDLVWSIETAQPPASGAGGSTARGTPRGGRSAAGSSALSGTSAPMDRVDDADAASDLTSMLGEPLPSLRPINPAGGAVDCDIEPGIVIHDDGTVENAYSGNPGATSEVIFADRFTPSAYPASFDAVCVAFVTQGPTSLDFELVVFDDDGAEGGPGTELGALAVSADGLPDPGSLPQPVWFSYDISSLGVVVDSGSIYIGARWAPSNPNVFLAADQSEGHPVGFAGGYWWNDSAGVWQEIEAPGGSFPSYRSMFIRAVENPGGCDNPSDIPWLSVTPESGTSPAGGSTPVEVAVDATGLEAGVHSASLCIATNDESRPLVVVPVRLVVTEGGVALAFDPSSLAFGDVDVGATSPPQTALLENLGSGAATGLSVTAPGGGFEIDSGGCGDTLPGGGSCEVSVTFAPPAPGPATATVTASSDQGPTATLDLAGNGIQDPPQIDVDPDSLSSTLREGETETSSLTLANSGDLPLEWEVPDEDVDTFERLGAIPLEEGQFYSAAIDPAGEFAYFGGTGTEVVKIDLETFEQVDALTLEFSEFNFKSAVIDPVGAFAYFGTALIPPGRVVKIDLETFERVGAAALGKGERELVSAVIDPAGEFAYFGTGNDPGIVVKIDLETFERVGAITLEGGEGSLESAVIDPAGEFAYFGTDTVPGRVVKIDLETFERIDAIPLENETNLLSAVIDPVGRFAYFGTDTGRVVKIDLETFERVDAIPLESGETHLQSAVIDPAGEFAYFGTDTVPGRVVKIDLETFERVDAVTLESDETDLKSAVIDPAGSFVYFGSHTPTGVVKIDLRRYECTRPDWVSVAPTSGSVPRDGSQVADVTFDATDLDPGDFVGNLCVTSNDPDQPVTTVPLALTVTPPAVALTFDPTDLAFGDVEVGDTSAPLSAALTNSGVEAASGLTFDPGDDAFTVAPGSCGGSLPAGASCTLSVTFAPTAPGPVTATLQAGSAEGASAELGLAGNGVAAGAVTPTALEVDPQELLSDGNGIFEPGELVIAAPWWRNDGTLPKTLTGAASDFVGPDGVAHTVEEGNADYGTLQPTEGGSCLDTGTCYTLLVADPAPRPVTHWDATFEETLDDPTDTGHTWTVHIGSSFGDVPSDNPFYPAIETLLHSGITGGCTDAEYCTGGAVSRSQMPVFTLRALEGSEYVPQACSEGDTEFSDVPASNAFCPWIEDLAGRGIVAGCGDGNYCPRAAVTRAQMAIFLLKTLEGADYTPPECSNRFDDVPCPSLFADWIEDLAAREITGGCSETGYCPGDPVSRAQMAVFISKTFGLVLYGP